MSAPRRRSPVQRAETWLWSGPVGHFAGSALDFTEALVRYWRARARGRTVR
jgi:hypothetical protein